MALHSFHVMLSLLMMKNRWSLINLTNLVTVWIKLWLKLIEFFFLSTTNLILRRYFATA